MYDAVRDYLKLTEAETGFLRTIEGQMGIVADLSRADILLYACKSDQEAVILGHAQPHSLAHAYSQNRRGRVVGAQVRPEVWHTLLTGRAQREQRSTISEGASVVRKTMPVTYPPPFPYEPQGLGWRKCRPIAALVIVTNLIEYERHRLRSVVFRRALVKLQQMLLYGRVLGAEALTEFGEQDGILFVDDGGIIRYASGIATNLYRHLGYKETLVGRHLSALETDDEALRRLALSQNRCVERESEEGGRVSIRKVIPLVSYPAVPWRWLKLLGVPVREQRHGVMITLHDDTESRRQDRELQIKNAMIKEVHHRVKNNLQTIAGLLRMQARRVKSEEARTILDETLHRILSIAVIHEFLSYESSNIINIKDVSHRIAGQLHQGVINPDKEIRFEVTGDPVYLPARQATASSLIINELLQNAIEHGIESRPVGIIRVHLADDGDEVMIKIVDNGEGIPNGFNLDQSDSLGLRIVKILVEGDLKGTIDFQNGVDHGEGLIVTIKFPKVHFEGEEGWKEHVSL